MTICNRYFISIYTINTSRLVVFMVDIAKHIFCINLKISKRKILVNSIKVALYDVNVYNWTENIYDNLLQPAKVEWQWNKTIIQHIAHSICKISKHKNKSKCNRLDKNVQIKLVKNANEWIRNLLISNLIYENHIPRYQLFSLCRMNSFLWYSKPDLISIYLGDVKFF